jgi:hypothetical protein
VLTQISGGPAIKTTGNHASLEIGWNVPQVVALIYGGP